MKSNATITVTFFSGRIDRNNNLAFTKKDGKIYYIYGNIPVFSHAEEDNSTFGMITSQFYVNGSATQAEISRAFGIPAINIKRAVKLYKKKGVSGFYEERKRRGAPVLTKKVLIQAQQLLPLQNNEWVEFNWYCKYSVTPYL